jgi:hypothetical protein
MNKIELVLRTEIDVERLREIVEDGLGVEIVEINEVV